MGTSLKNPRFRLIYMVVLPCIPKVYLIKITPVKVFSSLILSCTLIVLWSCSDSGNPGEPKIEGCMDSTACNYSIENTHDDGSCWTPTEGCSCDDSQGAIVDECGVCSGSGPIDSNHDCDGNCIVEKDICGTCGGTFENMGDCCEEGQIPDCDNVCGGPGLINTDGDSECCATGVIDCSNVCGGSSVLDDCDECGGDNSSCVNFSTEIQPIFTANCTGCHGSSGGLSLSSYASLMEGGSHGATVISNDGSGSLLIQKLKGTATSGGQMPASGCCLDASVIQLIETWIDEGALNN